MTTLERGKQSERLSGIVGSTPYHHYSPGAVLMPQDIVRVSPLRPRDLPAAIIIIRQAIAELSTLTGTSARRRDLWKANLRFWGRVLILRSMWPWRRGILVAARGRRLVGLLVAAAQGAERRTVLLISVASKERSKGIGGRLVDSLSDEAARRRLKTIELKVRAFDERVIAFYERHGFTVFERVKSYYRSGEDALSMVKHIAPTEDRRSCAPLAKNI